MNIKAVVFAIIVIFVVSGDASASAGDTEKQESVQETKTVQGSETALATETAEDAEDPNEWICKRVQKTGTRFKTKMCGTRAQWEESERKAKDVTEQMRNRPQYGKETG
ncbi:MAG: hypothetical protein GY732_19210 [Gammaproteobacteria bacterium]|nr:hypothetical protein [Gammaproteobacteria bacterium]